MVWFGHVCQFVNETDQRCYQSRPMSWTHHDKHDRFQLFLNNSLKYFVWSLLWLTGFTTTVGTEKYFYFSCFIAIKQNGRHGVYKQIFISHDLSPTVRMIWWSSSSNLNPHDAVTHNIFLHQQTLALTTYTTKSWNKGGDPKLEW